jgi:predicted AAA+ superfamily ATPase
VNCERTQLTLDYTDNLAHLADAFLERLNRIVGGDANLAAPDFTACAAYRYRVRSDRGMFEKVHHVDPITRDDLVGVDRQWDALDCNIRQLLRRLPCNHILLWGARGTGKSSLVKAALNAHKADGLRLVDVRRSGLLDLASIVDMLADEPYAFLVLLDDLSFEDHDPLARELKATLEGGVQAMPDNVRVVATANRRHLIPKRAGDNAWSDDDDLHVRDAAEEKISLADRFGLRLAFPAPTEKWYLAVVEALARRHGVPAHHQVFVVDALAWSRSHGLSGRSAKQFTDDWVGRNAIVGGTKDTV